MPVSLENFGKDISFMCFVNGTLRESSIVQGTYFILVETMSRKFSILTTVFKSVFPNIFLASAPFSNKQVSIAPYHA